MKNKIKVILVVGFSLLTAACSTNKPSNVLCDSLAQPLFDKFVEIADENKLEIDYRNISSVNVVPLAQSYNGLYNKRSKVILLNLNYKLPPVISVQLTKEQELKMLQLGIMFILAHEIGHSQGIEHDTIGSPTLMAYGDRAMYALLVEKSLDSIIVEALKKN